MMSDKWLADRLLTGTERKWIVAADADRKRIAWPDDGVDIRWAPGLLGNPVDLSPELFS